MADRLDFLPADLKRGMVVAKIVKPSSNDFILKPEDGGVLLFSSDKRRMMVSRIPATGGSTEDDSEYFIPASRSTLFSYDGDAATLSLGKDAVQIKIRGGGKTRQASFKKRSITSKRIRVPSIPSSGFRAVNAREFGNLLRAVSCSAMVRQTKTEEEMRVNQIHFYGDRAMSSTRYHASIAYLDGMDLDLSIVSSDVPSIRAFCSRVQDGDVQLAQDKLRLYVVDPSTKSTMIISRISTIKPPFDVLSEDGFPVLIKVPRADFLKSFTWASLAIEGTQRATLSVDESTLSLVHNGSEIVSIPVSKESGENIVADFPVGMLATISGYVDSDNILLRFLHKDAPTILEISGDSSKANCRHFIQSMKAR